MPNLSDAKNIMFGAKAVKEVWYGNKLIWRPPLKTWVMDFEDPGTHTITVPAGATHMHYWLSAGGNAGQRGDGALNRPGLGGRGGDVIAEGNLNIAASSVSVTIGHGGAEPKYAGEPSSFSIGEVAKKAPANGTLFSSNRDGDSRGFSSDTTVVQLLKQVPGMVGDGKIVVHGSDGALFNGPHGQYVGGDGTPGVRGGGGSGGAGGVFGSYRPGGPGGDGFCRIVFTNRQI